MARKPFTAVPLKAVRNPPRKRQGGGGVGGGRFMMIVAALTLTTFAAVFFYQAPAPIDAPTLVGPSEEDLRRARWPTTPETLDGNQPDVAGVPAPSGSDRGAQTDGESARFAVCNGRVRVTCVVDGDTLWYHGDKIRIADINAPEVSDPQCAHEARLGARATSRLTVLLNAGPFTLAPNTDGSGRDSDQYGRLLRTVTRDGASLGEVLVHEGLAEEWQGHRRSWC